MNVELYIESIISKLESISEYSDALKYQQEQKKLNRGQWVGGGYGIGGAIKGAATASAFNAVGGIFHGIGDAITTSSNNSKVSSLKAELYNDPNTYEKLVSAIFYCGLGGFHALEAELLEYDALTIEFQSDEAYALNKNALRYSTDDEQLREMLIKSVLMDPYEWSLYEPLFSKFPDTPGLEEFSGFFGVDKSRHFWKQLYATTTKRKIDKMPSKGVENQCKKLTAYLYLSKKENVDISDALKELTKVIVSEAGYTEDSVCKTRSYIQEHVSCDEYPGTQIILRALTEKARALTYKEVQKLSDKYSYRSPKKEKVVDDINFMLAYSDNYSRSVEKEIYPLLKDLNRKVYSSEELSDIAETLESPLSEKSALTSHMISAWKAKAPIMQEEERYAKEFGICPNLCSPLIFDVIEAARNGSVFCQFWLLHTLSPEEILTNSISEESNRRWELTDEQMESISDVTAFLFDEPSKYPFDLLMRLRLNLWSETADSYFECIESLKEANTCVAAQYEYAKYALTLNAAQDDTALDIMKNAALAGFYPAANFLSSRYASEEAGNELISPHAFFYEILAYRIDDYTYNSIYRYSCQHKYQAVSMLKNYIVLQNLLDGTFSFFRPNTFEFIWTDIFRYDVNNFGFIKGNQMEQDNISRVARRLNMSTTDGILSCEFNNGTQGILFEFDKVSWYVAGEGFCLNYQDIDQSSSAKTLNSLLERLTFSSDITQLGLIIYYGSLSCSSESSPSELMKMAFCENSSAISRLLASDDISDDRRQVWLQKKFALEREGKYREVCPNCNKPVSAEDLFCTNCGTKIKN